MARDRLAQGIAREAAPLPLQLLLLQDIGVTFGVTPLLAGAGLAVATGDRICLVGRNGSGKSDIYRAAHLMLHQSGDYAELEARSI